MAKMKDSGIEWIGQIPNNWEVDKIKYHLRRNESKNPGDKELLSVYRDYGVVPKDSRKDNHNVASEDTSNYKYVKKGNLVINKMKAWQGSLAISNYEGIVSPAYFIYKFTDDKFESKYFHYLIRSCYKDEFRRLSGGIREGQWDLSAGGFENTSVLIPSMLEQKRIMKYLDVKCNEIDSIAADKRQQIEILKEYKKSIITEVVTKGLNPDVEMKDSGVKWIDKIPVKWNIGKIKSYVDKVGSGKTPKGDDKLYTDGDILFLRSQNIYDTGIVLDENPTVITDVIDEEMANTRVKFNDVLLNITGGSIGRCCIYDLENKANINQHVSIIRTKKNKILPAYMHYFWISDLGQTAIKLYQTGGNREGMSAYAIKNTPIPIMSIQEQNEIINYLDKKCSGIDSIIADKKKQLEILEQYKKSLIYEYVTGKKEVPPNE